MIRKDSWLDEEIKYVKDNYNINATSIDIDANNITDSGNNTGWGFAAPPVVEEETPSTGGSSGSSSGNNSGGGGGAANSVIINFGLATTTSPLVTLTFNAPYNTQRIAVSNTPDFSSFVIVPY